MKTTTTLFITLLFFPSLLIAQVNSDILLQEGTKWTENFMDVYLGPRKTFKYEIKGDSLVENHIYKKVYANGEFNALLREDSDRKVYLRHTNPETKKESDLLLYTFGDWNIGDSIMTATPFLFYPDREFEIYTFKDTIQERDITNIRLKDGKDYKIYRNKIVHGIGDIKQGPLGMLQVEMDNGTYWSLQNFSTKDQILYGENSVYAQAHLVTEGVHWVERSSIEEDPEIPDPASTSYELAHFRINGDTIINNKTYKKVYRNEHYYTGLREENAFEVLRTTENGEYRLYTFDWKTPLGRFTNEKGKDFKLPTGSTERTDLAGGEYITCKVPYNPDPNANPFRTHNKDIRLILNIGLTSGIFSHIQPACKCLCFNDLVCFYKGDKLIYQNPVFTETGQVLSIDNTPKEGNLSVLVSGKEVVFTLKNLPQKQRTVLNVYTVEGMQMASYSLQNGAIIVKDLPQGIYLYELVNKKQKRETGKFCIGN